MQLRTNSFPWNTWNLTENHFERPASGHTPKLYNYTNMNNILKWDSMEETRARRVVRLAFIQN